MTPSKVLRYVNDKDGCRAELEGDQRIELSEEQWRQAIAKHFRPKGGEPVAKGPTYGNILDGDHL